MAKSESEIMTVAHAELRGKAREVCAYLLGLGNARILSARPVLVRIGADTFAGAEYVEESAYGKGTDGVTRGEVKEGDRNRETRYYLLGALPPSYRRKAVYTGLGKGTHSGTFPARCTGRGIGEWYIACHSPADAKGKPQTIPPHTAEFHPFGHTFILCEWMGPEAIDAHDNRTCPRSRMVCTVDRI